MKILGIDEAGRGPLIGPLVIAGALVDEKGYPGLLALKLRDSKQYTAKKREELYPAIAALLESYEIIIVPPSEIDAALADPASNLNWLEAQKMIELWDRFRPGRLIADCPSNNIGRFTEYVRNRIDQNTELVFEHRADENHAIVSAASILAKVTRDRSIENLKKVYGDFGSGYLADPKTQAFLRKDYRLPIYRKSWTTWKRLSREQNQKHLKDF